MNDITEIKRPYGKFDCQGLEKELRKEMGKARKATGFQLTELINVALQEFVEKYKDSIEKEYSLRCKGGLK